MLIVRVLQIFTWKCLYFQFKIDKQKKQQNKIVKLRGMKGDFNSNIHLYYEWKSSVWIGIVCIQIWFAWFKFRYVHTTGDAHSLRE